MSQIPILAIDPGTTQSAWVSMWEGKISDKGIDPSKFEVIGKGETDPVAPNNTPEGRQQNRRIEVQLINLLIPEE